MFTRPVESSITAPTISPNAGAILPSQTISISFSGDAIGAEYSFDGETWVTYTEPFTLSDDATVYAKATDGEGNYSSVVSNVYTLLPYDARVEYLQSSGTQYIDLDYTSTANSIISVDVLVNTVTTQGRFIGNSSGYFEAYINGSKKYSFASGGNTAVSSITVNTTTRRVVSINNVTKKGYIDNTAVTITQNGTSYYNSSFVFARPSSSSTYISGNLYSVVIMEGETTIRNMIPVRKDGVGYMYDTISGELFGNSGTGSFTYGNDVTT